MSGVDVNVAKALAKVARSAKLTMVITTDSGVYTLVAVENSLDWAGVHYSVDGTLEVVHGPVRVRDGALRVGRLTTTGPIELRLKA